MSNKLDNIYRHFGKDICLFPYMAAFYSTAGHPMVAPCTMVKFTGWGLEASSINKSLNSNQWIELRRNFISGSCHTTEFCKTCSLSEKNGGASPRQLNNQYFADHLTTDIVERIDTIIANDYKVNDLLSMDYCPSNYCDYECIMCFGGASSARQTFEIKVLGLNKSAINDSAVEKDFYNLFSKLEILNLTGGETLLQPQVHSLIDYLIEHDLAKNISVSLLTNASQYPQKLVEKFKKFKNIFYTISIDGIGPVIEYQRRGAKWTNVENNAMTLLNNFGCVINYVLTAVNVFSFVEFVDWLETNNIGKFNQVFISLVYDRTKHLSVDVIPPELKTELIAKLEKTTHTGYYLDLVNQVVDILKKSTYEPKLLEQFITAIRTEDTVSKQSLVDVVPEWSPYFE